ncbi:RNA methyltransferase [Riemerella anatipestifer]|uniref:RNA methyltransferase n=1 Tax=Riemerella anatipestifer TaxID=34085 RepID=UPI00209781AB|nr:RNA methyltransferase [Riemerella anatipestifer]MCO7352692.1 RNA methyltransferase [Riemerella anatipestifer]MCT6766814.1 RNA methyltransferase [Riemerella anatipestifer]
MLTSHKVKILQSLDKKKFRQKYNLFLVEGNKIIKELKNTNIEIESVYSVNSDGIEFLADVLVLITEKELKKVSFLKTPKDSLAVCYLPTPKITEDNNINLVLDGLQDPGNLGTIIRLADWFGIEQIVCSTDTVDVYNPKVIQATMGSFTRVNVVYSDIEQFLLNSPAENIGTDMEGENLYKTNFPKKFNLVLGNEGNGMRPSVERLMKRNITIPRFGNHKATESLNVSMAAGVILGQVFSDK